jgi:hypothetical protein
MASISSVNNLNLSAQEYGSLNAQRKRSEADGLTADNAQAQAQGAAAEQQAPEQQNAAIQARREAIPEVACPTAKEMPGIMAGLVSGIAQSPAWKLAEIQPAGKGKLVPAAYV